MGIEGIAVVVPSALRQGLRWRGLRQDVRVEGVAVRVGSRLREGLRRSPTRWRSQRQVRNGRVLNRLADLPEIGQRRAYQPPIQPYQSAPVVHAAADVVTSRPV